ncbi:MAG TPA: type II secretion system protein GspC [Anaeromyxobacter sp.]|nr:type II secretion system protein GspC [Anaeromyxobacter sp.]
MLDLFFRKYAWTANLALLFLTAWFTARIVNTVVGAFIRPRPRADLGSPAAPAPRNAPAVALDETRLYHLIGVEPPQKSEPNETVVSSRPQNCSDPLSQPVKSELHLSLVAAVQADPPGQSLATLIDGATREAHALGVGERFGNTVFLGLERMATDGDITHNAYKLVAVVCNDGTKEYVEADTLPPSGEFAMAGVPNLGTAPVPRPGPGIDGIRSVGQNLYQIDRKVLDGLLGDFNQLATQARIVPSFKNGVANGFKLFSIQPGSIYSAIGVENGDVIQRVNGYEINSPEKALELYQKLRESSHVTIELERNGQPIRKEYNIGS